MFRLGVRLVVGFFAPDVMMGEVVPDDLADYGFDCHVGVGNEIVGSLAGRRRGAPEKAGGQLTAAASRLDGNFQFSHPTATGYSMEK
jgi:hypothetical protein